VIENGGTARARRLAAPLAALPAAAEGWAAGGPVLVLVGEVVALGAVATPPAPALAA
jgi:siroheme synthase